MKRLVNLSLRVSTLLSKFLLLIYLAKFLPAETVGLYGLLLATISYLQFALGFEFYVYSIRELIGLPAQQKRLIFRDQCIFYAISYSFVFPFVILFFTFGLLPFHLFFWFIALLALEHLSLELGRFLTAISEPIKASILFLIQNGARCLLSIVIMVFFPVYRNLETVLFLWALGSIMTCVLGFFWVKQLDTSFISRKINWPWIRQGIKTAFPFLLASLSIRGIFTLDKFWVETNAGLEILGAYVFFSALGNALMSVLDSTIIAFAYPKIVASAKLADIKNFNNQMHKLWLGVFLEASLFIVIAWFLGKYLILFLDKAIYITYYSMFKWILLTMFFYVLALVPQIGLYALKMDGAIIWGNMLGLLAFVVFLYGSPFNLGMDTIFFALNASFLIILLWRTMAYFLLKNNFNFCQKGVKFEG